MKAIAYVPYDGPIVKRLDARAAGLTRYFTGKPCEYGHLAERGVASYRCHACGLAWKAANRDAINAAERERHARNPGYFKKHYQANAERIKARTRASYRANPGPVRAYSKRWAQEHPDQVLAYKQAHYTANVETIKQRVRDWNTANPEAARTRGRNYRARLYAADGEHTGDDIKALFVKQKGRCIYCSKGLGDTYHVDHIQPLSRGGSNHPANLQLTCGPCNNNKRATDPIEYARRIGRLL